MVGKSGNWPGYILVIGSPRECRCSWISSRRIDNCLSTSFLRKSPGQLGLRVGRFGVGGDKSSAGLGVRQVVLDHLRQGLRDTGLLDPFPEGGPVVSLLAAQPALDRFAQGRQSPGSRAAAGPARPPGAPPPYALSRRHGRCLHPNPGHIPPATAGPPAPTAAGRLPRPPDQTAMVASGFTRPRSTEGRSQTTCSPVPPCRLPSSSNRCRPSASKPSRPSGR